MARSYRERAGDGRVERYCQLMDLGILSLVGTSASVLALIGIVVGIITYRRQFPKREIRYELRSTPLLYRRARWSGDARFQVSFNGAEIADPYVFFLTVWSQSRADIASGAFDGAQPVRFISDTPMIVTDAHPGTGIALTTDIEDVDGSITEVRIEPQLIRRKAKSTVVALAEGRPTIRVDNPLIDIDVKLDNPSTPRGYLLSFWRDLKWLIVGMLVILVGGVALSVLPGIIGG